MNADVVSSADILRCPIRSLDPRHYVGGTCRCNLAPSARLALTTAWLLLAILVAAPFVLAYGEVPW